VPAPGVHPASDLTRRIVGVDVKLVDPLAQFFDKRFPPYAPKGANGRPSRPSGLLSQTQRT